MNIVRQSSTIALPFGCLAGLAFIASCVGTPADEKAPEGSEAVGEAAQELACAVPEINPAQSLMITRPKVLAQFPLQDVLTRVVSLAGVAGPTPLRLYQRWWDSQNKTPNVVFPDAIHCDSETTGGVPTINQFPIQCPRNEGRLALTNPFLAGPDRMLPLAIVNRFDLTPTDGSHCGEYRIIYGKESGMVTPQGAGTDRNLIIFEAVLPNPDPACGVAACRPVADFWANLSALDLSDPYQNASFVQQVHDFYFVDGTIPGFPAAIRPEHYGMGASGGGYGATAKGQIRTNQFMNPPGKDVVDEKYGEPLPGSEKIWQLREFQLERVCPKSPDEELPEEDIFAPEPSGCRLQFKPVTVKNNPFITLFEPPTADPRHPAFQSSFIADVEPLSDNNVNGIGMNTGDLFNAGQSNSQDAFPGAPPILAANDYLPHLNVAGNPFIPAIDGRLAAIGRTDMAALDIANRATTQGCGGCHQINNDDRLGGVVDPKWPPSGIFVHVNENPGPNQLSPALRFVFLPHRKQVLRRFLESTCGVTCESCSKDAALMSQSSAEKTLGGSKTH